ncbi:MAG: group III truncated hemoglobin [Saprospiraceae bacterium]|nr:group III truncated hemoglobin [Saprospiraceae bacterium]
MDKKDIKKRKDVEVLVDQFYNKIREDTLLQPMFAHVHWEKHLPIMYDFWENVLFYTGQYTGNPMQVHRKANAVNPINSEHFERWLKLFYGTVDEHFVGENADIVKERAASIAKIMQSKFDQ